MSDELRDKLEALLPCEFCGDPMRVTNAGDFRHVDAGDCLIGQLSWQADERYISKWNTRAKQLVVADGGEGFQERVGEWMLECFGPTISMDRLERRDRLVEETLELAQTLPDFTADRAHALVDYVFDRPVGVTEQEVGGVSVTLAALCYAEGIDQAHWAGVELDWIEQPEIVQKIRAKQATKPTGSALPALPLPTSDALGEAVDEAIEATRHQMDNYLPKPGEQWETCLYRRLKDNIITRMEARNG